MPMSARHAWFALPLLMLMAGVVAPAADKPTAAPSPTAAGKALSDMIVPFLDKHCNACHNSDKQSGGVPLDIYTTEAAARKDRVMWETIARVVANGEMPPKRKPQPDAAAKAEFLTLVDESFIKVNCVGPKNPGRVTLRRLNRAEYNNTVRDLCGVTFHPADDFPSDDVGYGFDNIGVVLPILLEKYLSAADSVLGAAVVPPGTVLSSKQRFPPQNLRVEPRSARRREPGNFILLTQEGTAFLPKFNFPAAGDYTIRVKASGIDEGGQPAKLQVAVDDKALQTHDVRAAEDKPVTVETTHWVEAGERKLATSFVNPSDPKSLKSGVTPRTLRVHSIEVVGPLKGGDKPLPESTKRILVAIPKTPDDDRKCAEAVVAEFARRAYRRPVKPEEVTRLMQLYDLAAGQGDRFDRAVLLPLKAVLVSPNFLFRVEADPAAGQAVRPLNDFELATRLSYFLWSTMPDAELYSAAERNELRKPGVLAAHVKRMLAHPNAVALTENFAGQWLQLRNLRGLSPDPETYKSWDDALRNAMIRESELFFENVVKEDRSVLDFLDADYTFVNDRLSWHYGIPNVRGTDFRKVKLPDGRRGGLVSQASILTVTSNPTRTSPVKRGKWIYENVLGLQPPPVPPGVPELPKGQLKGTLRQQMEQHRADPSCAGCHAKLDPLGFGLENFDGIGGWRDQDNKIRIDATGVLPDGEKFDGPAELRKVLLGKAELFRRCLAEKLLTYATGRGLEYYDKCVLDELSLKLKAGDDRFSALVLAIVECDAFQKRKATRSE
jgi:hypothetical protein